MDSMTAAPGHRPASSISTLTPNGCKARFGAAYVRAICSHAGVGFTENSPDEDVLAVDGKVELAEGYVRVQIKCTGQYRIVGGKTASWPAEQNWWDKWQQSRIPVYLILVMVDPDDQLQWLEHRDDGTLNRAAAFWVRVDKMPSGSAIAVPKTQRLFASTLAEWSTDLLACYVPAPDRVQ